MIRRAFSLIELLVVLAITAVLVGLLLSAVQSVRASADRMACSSRLRQVALATELYHDSHECYPQGSSGRQDAFRNLSWLARILPFMDQAPLWDTIGAEYAQNSTPLQPVTHTALALPMPLFSCPSDVRTSVAWRLPEQPESPIAMTSFLGNWGTSVREPNGVLFRNSKTRHVQILDGASNTLLAGERPPSPNLIYGWWYYGVGQGGGSLDYLIGSLEINQSRHGIYQACGGPHPYGPGSHDNYCSTFHYWSLHANGANFAFCDGSVRFLSYAARDVLPLMATKAGGECFDVP